VQDLCLHHPRPSTQRALSATDDALGDVRLSGILAAMLSGNAAFQCVCGVGKREGENERDDEETYKMTS